MVIAEFTMPGMHVRDCQTMVPLDWRTPSDGRAIEIFWREVTATANARDQLPLLVFLQGGPGLKSPRPGAGDPVWLVEALKTHRVILADQRGTGRSTRVERATMGQFSNGERAADYLSCFRAESIVADLEHIRNTTYEGRRWEILGQSFGGFITLTYLSQAPEGIDACYITGGVPDISPSAEDTYRRTYSRVAAKNARLHKRYPHDAARLTALADFIDLHRPLLPDGDRLTVRRFQTVGVELGMASGIDDVHWLIDEAFSGPMQDRLSDHFLSMVMSMTSYHGNPLYAALHETIYAQGSGRLDWAADRVRGEFPEFGAGKRPLLFTGEMIYPWMFDEISSLRPFRAAAQALANRTDYPALYDPRRLAANEVPVAAAIYHDDMYVDCDLSLKTIQAIGNADYWITNEFEHDGVRRSGNVVSRLFSTVRDGGSRRQGSLKLMASPKRYGPLETKVS